MQVISLFRSFLTYSFFNKTVRKPKCMESNGGIIREETNEKDV
jgi:hypothetical protein